MDYNTLDDDIPPPLDDVSSAGGTEGDLEDYDLDSANLNPYGNATASQKHYKSFQPIIKLKPSDLVYREEHSRAAPRKGIEPKAFLAIGETRQEHAEYVGKHPVTAPAQHQNRQAASANTKKYTHNQQRHASVHSAPVANRNKSRISRTTSGKGRQSAWSSAGYTPLPVAPPPVLPVKENTYVIHPFKHDSSADHRLDSNLRRLLSPGEELKQATILATMEVGRFINQREKTPKVTKYRQPRLLKARLRPLNTVNVQGPEIHQCQGVQADDRKFGPSPMKTRQQKKLDDVIKKNAAIKDMPTANYGSRNASSKLSAAESRRKSSPSSKNTVGVTERTAVSGREPTPSPYSSMTHLDKVCKEPPSHNNPDKNSTHSDGSRPESAAQSDATHTEQETIARSVSSVTIKQKSCDTPNRSAKPNSGKESESGVGKVTVFITDADSDVPNKSELSEKLGGQDLQQEKTKPSHKEKGGCREFMETNAAFRDDDDDKRDVDSKSRYTEHLPPHVTAVNTTSDTTQQSFTQTSENVKQSSNIQDVVLQQTSDDHLQISWEQVTNQPSPQQISTNRMVENKMPANQTLVNKISINQTKSNELSSTDGGSIHLKQSSTHRSPAAVSADVLDGHSTFITAGFLTLESLISDARHTLRHSYSLNDLDKSCDWDEPISSPRSVEVLNKGVTFAKDVAEHYYYDPPSEQLNSEELQLKLYNDLEQSEVNRKSPEVTLDTRQAETCVDSPQKESACRYSVYGIHGEISEYLTNKSLVRRIYPPPAPKITKSSPSSSSPALNSEQPLSSAASSCEAEACETTLLNPPPTPALTLPLEYLSSVESLTPELNSPISSLESPESEGKCFLETIVDLMPESSQTLGTAESHPPIRSALPKAVEGTTKPFNSRQHSHEEVEPIAAVAPACFRITALPSQGHIFYFAYDADMMQGRFSTLLGRKVENKLWGLLFGFQLIFNKTGVDREAGLFANIEANANSSTEGAVYTIGYDELAIVDGLHGYPHHYARLLLPVWVCNSSDPDNYSIAQYCVPAVTYIAQDNWTLADSDFPASKDYSLKQCISGSDQLSKAFQGSLRSMLVDCGV